MKKIIFIIVITVINFIIFINPIYAVEDIYSDNYKIQWPNVNMGSGNATSTTNKMGITTGQLSPGLFSSTGFKVRSGFQYIHSVIPFAFSLSTTAINFGNITAGVLTNQQNLTLEVDCGSAGGYQVTVHENQPLTILGVGITIPNTSCDPSDECTKTAAGTWALNTTYGFGFTMNGTDVPADFANGTKFRSFAVFPPDEPAVIMGGVPGVDSYGAGSGKTAVMTLRINPSEIQAAGTYQNILKFTAIPTY